MRTLYEAKAQPDVTWDDDDAAADLAILAKVKHGNAGPIQFTPVCRNCTDVMCQGCDG